MLNLLNKSIGHSRHIFGKKSLRKIKTFHEIHSKSFCNATVLLYFVSNNGKNYSLGQPQSLRFAPDGENVSYQSGQFFCFYGILVVI